MGRVVEGCVRRSGRGSAVGGEAADGGMLEYGAAFAGGALA